jgi:hypothetical protein
MEQLEINLTIYNMQQLVNNVEGPECSSLSVISSLLDKSHVRIESLH